MHKCYASGTWCNEFIILRAWLHKTGDDEATMMTDEFGNMLTPRACSIDLRIEDTTQAGVAVFGAC